MTDDVGERFWIVVRMDRKGPVEQGRTPEYKRHSSFEDASREARRLMAAYGGFWAILHPVWVMGTIDRRIRPNEDDYIPF